MKRLVDSLPLILFPLLAMPLPAQVSRLDGRLDRQTRTAVVAIVDSVGQLGLPTEPLVTKALEGSSRGASGTRIVAAVRALARDLGTARDALGRSSSAAELVAGAGAVRAGVGPQILARLRTDRPGRSVAMELVVLADLISRGVPADTAAALVSQLAASDAGGTALEGLRRDVARDISEGVPPAIAAVLRTRGVLVAAPGSRADAIGEASGPGRITNSKP